MAATPNDTNADSAGTTIKAHVMTDEDLADATARTRCPGCCNAVSRVQGDLWCVQCTRAVSERRTLGRIGGECG
jgi:hypothetical protein